MIDFVAGFVACALLSAAVVRWVVNRDRPILHPGTKIAFRYPRGGTIRLVVVRIEKKLHGPTTVVLEDAFSHELTKTFIRRFARTER